MLHIVSSYFVMYTDREIAAPMRVRRGNAIAVAARPLHGECLSRGWGHGMATFAGRDLSTQQERFVQYVVAHHRSGDFYPDPQAIGRELHLTHPQTEAVLRDLRAIGWIAASPYQPEQRIRLTPRCWDALRRAPVPQPISRRNAA
jgi:hypothetical protein